MLDEEYVKRLFAKGYFESWEPEHEQWGALKSLFIQERLDIMELTNPKDKMVLDVGTGKGRFAISFAVAGASKIIAVDISKAMLVEANKRAIRAEVIDKVVFEKGDADQIEYVDESFDIVCCMDTLVHLPNPLKAIKELTRVCKIGGHVVANVTNNDPLWKQYYASPSKSPIIRAIYKFIGPIYSWKAAVILRIIGYIVFNITRRKAVKPYYRHYSLDELLDLFTDESLEIEQILEYGTPVPVFFCVLASRVVFRQ